MATVREAETEDIPRILELYRELVITTSRVETDQHQSLTDYHKVFNEIHTASGHHLLVAEDEGNVVGTAVLLIAPNLSHGGLYWALVENMVVDHRYRRQGVGRLLMDYVLVRAKEASCYKLTLSSNKKRRGAHSFYRAMGLEATSHGFRMYF